MEVSELMAIVREDYLDDVFDGWENASQAERDDQFLWKDKTLFRYLTEAQRQACNRVDLLYNDSYQIPMKPGINSYQIDQNINVLESVMINDRFAKHISKEDRQRYIANWQTDSGIAERQTFYVVRGRKMLIYPIPGPNDTGKINMTIWHQPLSPVTTVTDQLVIPDEYHRDLIWWMLYEAYSKQDADGYDASKGQGYLAQFEGSFGPYVSADVRVHELEEPTNVEIRPVDYSPPYKDGKFSDSEWYR